eukprot:jgi/Astpho2/5747/fgenesh1_pg.00080_%23_16_t
MRVPHNVAEFVNYVVGETRINAVKPGGRVTYVRGDMMEVGPFLDRVKDLIKTYGDQVLILARSVKAFQVMDLIPHKGPFKFQETHLKFDTEINTTYDTFESVASFIGDIATAICELEMLGTCRMLDIVEGAFKNHSPRVMASLEAADAKDMDFRLVNVKRGEYYTLTATDSQIAQAVDLMIKAKHNCDAALNDDDLLDSYAQRV